MYKHFYRVFKFCTNKSEFPHESHLTGRTSLEMPRECPNVPSRSLVKSFLFNFFVFTFLGTLQKKKERKSPSPKDKVPRTPSTHKLNLNEDRCSGPRTDRGRQTTHVGLVSLDLPGPRPVEEIRLRRRVGPG